MILAHLLAGSLVALAVVGVRSMMAPLGWTALVGHYILIGDLAVLTSACLSLLSPSSRGSQADGS